MLLCMLLRMLLCMLEAVGGELCSLDVLEAMRCMLLRMLDAVEDGLGFRVSKVKEAESVKYFNRSAADQSTADRGSLEMLGGMR